MASVNYTRHCCYFTTTKGFTVSQKTSWDQFSEAGAKGVLFFVAIFAALFFPPLWIVYGVALVLWILNKILPG